MKNLDCKGIKIEDINEDINSIIKYIRLKKCEDVNLAGCDLTPEALVRLVTEIFTDDEDLRLTNLKSLSLADNTKLDEKAWKMLGSLWAMDKYSGLERINLSGCELDNDGLLIILQATTKNLKINEINVDSVEIDLDIEDGTKEEILNLLR
jgi:hypothetical protein